MKNQIQNSRKINKTKIDKFRICLEAWKKTNGLREYPWRSSTNSFEILITEILLRRTKSNSVAKIWKKFFSKYNRFSDILQTNKSELQSDIQSLGLENIRSNTLIEISSSLADESIPNDEKDLKKLKGIGDYSARMYLLLAKQESNLIYDTNFRRVYSRYFDLDIGANLRNDKNIKKIAELVQPKTNLKEYIYTILDFAAITCKPINPNCSECFCSQNCSHYKEPQED